MSVAVTSGAAMLLVPHHAATGAAAATSIGYVVAVGALVVVFARAAGVGLRELAPRWSDVATYRRLSVDVLRRGQAR